MNIEIIKIVIPIANLLIGALLNTPVLNFTEQLKKRRLKNYIESQSALDNLDEDFQNNFIKPNLKEIYFYLQTGISTNEKSIDKYIELKNKLGGNYTWEKVKLVESNVNLKSITPLLNLNKAESITSNFTLGLIIILMLVGLFGVIVLNLYSDVLQFNDYLIILFLIFIPLIIGIVLMQMIKSTLIVKAMIKRLEEQEVSNNVTLNNEPIL